MPARFVSDPSFEWTGSGFESDLINIVQTERGETATSALDAAVAMQLMRFSSVASRWIARHKLSAEEVEEESPESEGMTANE